MKTSLCSILLLMMLNCVQLPAQFIQTKGSRAASMAGTSVTSGDTWSILNNPAGLANIREFTCGISYENRFVPWGPGIQSLVATLPSRWGTFGTRISYSGGGEYREYSAGLAFARGFGPNLAAGILLDLFYEGFPETYGHSLIPACEIGIQLKLKENLRYGLHLFNPTMSKIGNNPVESIPVIISSGFNYFYSDKLNISAEVCKSSGFPMELHLGFEYLMNKQLVSRWGIATKPFRYSFGFGYTLGNMETDFAAQYHESLGFSPQISLLYHFLRGK